MEIQNIIFLFMVVIYEKILLKSYIATIFLAKN